MFESTDAARAVLREALDTARVEQLVEALRPAIAFEPRPAAEEPRLGGTRIGGTPDLASDAAWPVRPIPVNIDQIVARGGSNHGDHIREHLSRAIPLSFLAQVDLKEAASRATDLPDQGRLLFFYDVMVGPWDTGATSCRVIWDRTPVAQLVRQALPNILHELGEKHIAELCAAMSKWRRERDMPTPKKEDYTSPYSGSARAMQLRPVLQLPGPRTVEVQTDAHLQALLEHDDVAARLEEIRDRVYSYETAYQRHQLLGLPTPEQDDPRYQAVVVTAFGVQHLPHDEWKAKWPAIRDGASGWRLLMQVALDDYQQDRRSEGTVYFLIRNDDLAVRNFASVVAVYQQT